MFRPIETVLADKPRASSASAGWGFAEAVWFFIIPDVFVTLVASRKPRFAPMAVLCALAGAVAGWTVLYAFASSVPETVRSVMETVPLVFPSMFSAVSDGLSHQGWMAMVEGASKGIPYKLYAAEAGSRGLPFWPFVAWSVAARSYRIALSAAVAAGAGAALRKAGFSDRAVLGTWTVAWIGIYAAYAVIVMKTYA